MSEAGKYLENYRKHGSLPFANTDGDYLASKKELISLLEQYHKTQTKKDMPSDEEINKEANMITKYAGYSSFLNGADWLKQKLLNK